jgi:PLP dependent protein
MPLIDNLARVRDQMAAACRRAGRVEREVALMAVTKMHPADTLQEAYAAGLRLFGENRVQEWQQKQPALQSLFALPQHEATPSDLPARDCAQVHLIGPLQSNKTTRATELFDAIDTVDSLKIAIRLDAAARMLDRRLPILIEVKLSHEESKHGVAPAELPALLEALAPLDALVPAGLMTVPPWSEDAELARPYFRELRRLRDALLAACPRLIQLSMGMSNDFAVAIEEGSTCVRIGTALFGPRVYAEPTGE